MPKTKEFKIQAVKLAEESDKPITQIARELGVRQNQIYKWKKELEAHWPGRKNWPSHYVSPGTKL